MSNSELAVVDSQAAIAAAKLPVVETFHSVQGEGVWTGSSAFFIRLAGCDVGCPWCDTKHSWPAAHHPLKTIEALTNEAVAARPAMVVITGGEPLMHNLELLTQALRQQGLRVHLETSGAYPLSGQFDWISLSPKPFKPPLEDIYSQADEVKAIVGEPEDLVWLEAIASKVSGRTVKLIQPRWEETVDEQGTMPARQLAFDYVLAHPEWRMSLQTHKFLGVR